MISLVDGQPNAAVKFAHWLAAHPIRQSLAVSPRRPAWITRQRPRIKALVEAPRVT